MLMTVEVDVLMRIVELLMAVVMIVVVVVVVRGGE